MPIQDYYNALDRAGREVRTLLHTVRKAHIRAEETTIGNDGLVNPTALQNEDALNTATRTLTDTIEREARRLVIGNADADADLFQNARAMAGYIGMSSNELKQRFLAHPDFDGFYNEMRRSTRNHIDRTIIQTPLNTLTLEDRDEAVNHTHTAGRVDPAKLTIEYMAQILNEYQENGVVSNRSLQGKQYLVDGINLPNEGIDLQ